MSVNHTNQEVVPLDNALKSAMMDLNQKYINARQAQPKKPLDQLQLKLSLQVQVQLKLASLSMKISSTTLKEFIIMFLVLRLVDMQSNLSDGVFKVKKGIGLLLTHGEQVGEKQVTLKLDKEIVE